MELDSRCGTHHHIHHKTTCIPPCHHGYMCDSSTYQPINKKNIIEWWNQTVDMERIVISVTQQHVFLPVTTATCMTVVHINLKQEEYHWVVESDSRYGMHRHIRHTTTCIPPRHHGYMCDSSTYQPETRRISLSGEIRQYVWNPSSHPSQNNMYSSLSPRLHVWQ